MNEKCFGYLSLIFLFLGIYSLVNSFFNIAGEVIGLSSNSSRLDLIFGGTFMFLSFISSSPGREPIGRLERKIVSVCGAVLLAIYMGLSINANFVPRKTEAVIKNVSVSNYEGKSVYIVETDHGRFRNEDSSFYGKHNSEILQKRAEKLKGERVKIKNYGYGRLEFREYPLRNVLDITRE